MATNGSVPIRDVEMALKRYGCEVIQGEQSGGDDGYRQLQISRGDSVISGIFAGSLPRRQLHYLARTFDVPIHIFYHPDFQTSSESADP